MDILKTQKTNFRFNFQFAKLWPWLGNAIPYGDRYRLGGINNLRGYDYGVISPLFKIMRTPFGGPEDFRKGGDREIFGQIEYFIPLIPEAGIKSLLFADAGRVFDDEEKLTLDGLSKDIGVGFRWITPIAPFRFEWAWPIDENGKVGNMKLIFNIGY